MIKVRKRSSVRIFTVFLVCMVLAVTVFVQRIRAGNCETPYRDGEDIESADEYVMGGIYDRGGKLLVCGDGCGDVAWADADTERLFKKLASTDIASSINSSYTICGNASWLYGTEDDRLNAYGLKNPFTPRTGGSVRLTLDLELTQKIDDVVKEKGYEDAYVIVSNYRTGELLAMYSDTGNPLKDRYHPGSTMKPIIAAAALSQDPDLVKYKYNCSSENHVFKTVDGGSYMINCDGGELHGHVDMADAIAYSCNGYFSSLAQRLDKVKLCKTLHEWGIDDSLSYSQLTYTDGSFLNGSDSSVDYIMAAIGQANCFITPFQMNLIVGALMNHGVLVEPRWFSAKQINSLDDGEWSDMTETQTTQICGSDVADTVADMMLGVCEYGTGTRYSLSGFASKTGTAETTDKDGELTGLNTIWTTGGLLDDNNPYSITVCINNVNGVGSDAGVIATEILSYLIEKYDNKGLNVDKE